MALSDNIVFAQHRAYAMFPTAGFGSTNRGTNGNVVSSMACDSIKTCLVGANWTQTGTTQATALVQWIFGVPTITSSIFTGFQFIWNGLAYWFYVTGQVPPPSITVSSGTYMVVPILCGGTPGASLTAMAAAMTSSNFTCTVQPGNSSILITANLAATAGNGYVLIPSGGNVLSAPYTAGGGWICQSNTEQALVTTGQPGPANTAYFIVTVQTIPGVTSGPDDTVQITITPQNVNIGSSGSVTYLLAIGQWMAIANDYNLYLFLLGGATTEDLNYQNNTLWAVTPMLQASGQSNPSAGCFVAYGATQESSYPVQMWVGNDWASSGWGQLGASLQTYRFPDAFGELYTAAGQSMLQLAIIALNPGNAQASWIGFIADAFVDSHYTAPYGQAAQTAGDPLNPGGQTMFRTVAGQSFGNNTANSLWVASGEPVASSGAGGGSGGSGGNGGGSGSGSGSSPGPVVITVSPSPLNILAVGSGGGSGAVTIATASTMPVTISVGFAGLSWVTITGFSGTSVSSSVSQTVNLTANTSGQNSGNYAGTLTVTPTGGASVSVPVNIIIYDGLGMGLSGLCNTQGPFVYNIGGSLFSMSMVGGTIIIAGNAYTVAGYFGSSIEVSPSPPNMTDVPWHT